MANFTDDELYHATAALAMMRLAPSDQDWFTARSRSWSLRSRFRSARRAKRHLSQSVHRARRHKQDAVVQQASLA